ncbi:MAG TPA: hypothetical protein PKW52_06965 [Nitrospira sp.]|nr:hypothetical protein [Nitrospira sp. NTP1]HQR14967.1 hypothetical protein [Nitrospira sp.]HQV11061.1 hypothetical protein [Nitrospira sp.]
MRILFAMALLVLAWSMPAMGSAEVPSPLRPLHTTLSAALATLPPENHLLLDREPIEQFLAALDGAPPDWSQIYGQGHHDPGHDERLFALNRARDARREGKEPLQWLVTVVWFGELSRFDEAEGGFRVALGPKFNRTSWGEVRFKHEDLPATLIVSAGEVTADLKARMQRGERIEIDVVMCGRLVPDESLVYDFSHDVEGQGLIMPVVRIEAVAFVLPAQSNR